MVVSAAEDSGIEAMDEYSTSRRSKFRFKSKRAHADDHHDEHDHNRRKRRKSDDDGDRTHSHSHRHHHRSKRRKSTSTTKINDDPTLYDDTYMPNSRSAQYLDPDSAFRESLFDALADDEGALYWESVYGQPIHTYPAPMREGPEGELERMSDDEYAEYVRARMWEKTHEAVLEERRRREEVRRREKERRKRTREMEEEGREFERSVEEGLRRGEERRRATRWKEAWERYGRGWEELQGRGGKMMEEKGRKEVGDVIPWPVESGRWKDVSKEDVENFFRNAPPAETSKDTLLKAERVRWHPDKIQQRFGEQGVDSGTMKSVTAVFQVVDRLWSDVRDQKSKS